MNLALTRFKKIPHTGDKESLACAVSSTNTIIKKTKRLLQKKSSKTQITQEIPEICQY